MVTEGLAICRAIHDRYHPSRFNPYNEVECGDHYARALASWGVYLALAGFRYHGPKARLGFAPRITPGDFKAAVTFAEGWGRLSQQRAGSEQRNKVDVLRGSLRLREFSIALPEGAAPKRVAVYAGGARPRVETAQDAEQLTLAFSEDVRLEAGQNLDVKVSLA
jgi:hypothetical protein